LGKAGSEYRLIADHPYVTDCRAALLLKMIEVTTNLQIQMTAADKAFGFILFGYPISRLQCRRGVAAHRNSVGRFVLIGQSQSTTDARYACQNNAANSQCYFQCCLPGVFEGSNDAADAASSLLAKIRGG
jgi:hypothetical protein